MLNDDNLQALLESGRRIMIFGKFTAEQKKDPIFLSDSGRGEGKVSAVGFFSAVQPELGSIRGATEIGNVRVNAFRLCTPTDPKCVSDKTFPVLMDSPLLDLIRSKDAQAGDSKSPRDLIQKLGGQLFKSLLEDIDVVARYSGAEFSGKLLELGAQYIPRWVNSHESVDVEKGWEVGVPRVLMSDPLASELILNYLTCYSQDEPGILQKFRERIDEIKDELEMKGKDKLIELMCDSLSACKQDLVDEQEDAGVLGLLMGSRDFRHLKSCKDPAELHTSSFVKHYNNFLGHSNNVHRLARTEAMHSFLLTWFSSKFVKHDENLGQVSEKMFEKCVEQQAGRIPALTQEEVVELQGIVDTVEVSDEVRETVNSRNNEDLRLNFERNIEMRKKNMKIALTLPRKVTREKWADALRALFVSVAQMTGGAVADLLERDRMLTKKYEKFYIDILRQDVEELSPEAFLEKAKKSLSDRALADEKEFVEQVFDLQGDLPQDTRALRWVLTRRCVEAWEERCNSAFSEGYAGQIDEIEQEFNTLSRAYELIRLKRAVSSKESNAGSIHVVTEMVLPENLKTDKRAKKTRIEKTLKAMEMDSKPAPAATPSRKVVNIPAPSQLKPGQYPILKEDGVQTTATITVQEDSGAAELDISPAEFDEVVKGKLRIPGEGEEPESEITIAELEIPLDTILDIAIEETSAKLDLSDVTEMDRVLGERIEAIRDAYLSDTENDDLEMGYRALLFGEYVLSAPSRYVNLGEDDLSGVLAIMMDLVQNVGSNPAKNADLYTNAVLPESDVRLTGVNLSKYYRLGDSDDLSKILQYHYTMCQEATEQVEYLQELLEIGNFLDSIGGKGVEVVIFDQTLAEHVESTNQASQFCLVKYPSVFTYLSTQSLAPTQWSTFQGKYESYMGQAAASTFQFPTFISPQRLPDGAPVIDSRVLRLPTFSSTDHEGETDVFVVDQVIQERPTILLCVAALLETADFGRTLRAYDSNLEFSKKYLNDFALVDESSVFQMLRHLWIENQELAAQMWVCRLYSIAHVLRAQLGGTVADEIGTFIGKIEQDDYAVAFKGIEPLKRFLPTEGPDGNLSWSIGASDENGRPFLEGGMGSGQTFRTLNVLDCVPAPSSGSDVPFDGKLRVTERITEFLGSLN